MDRALECRIAVDHACELLLHRLDRTFGVRGQAKEWFESYLIVLRYIRRENLIGYSSDMLRTAGFSSGLVVIYSVGLYSGPS